jgi:hypothetical protein
VGSEADYTRSDHDNYSEFNLQNVPAKANANKECFVKLSFADRKPSRHRRLPTNKPMRKTAMKAITMEIITQPPAAAPATRGGGASNARRHSDG